MDHVQYLANLAEILSGLTVIFGVSFGAMEYRRHKKEERRQAAATLASSFQTRELSGAIRVVLELPEPIDEAGYRALTEDERNLIWFLCGSMESVGILVFRGDLPLKLVDDFFSLPIVLGWRKLLPWVESLRERHGPQAWEWYEWLHDQLSQAHSKSGRIPAHIRHGTR